MRHVYQRLVWLCKIINWDIISQSYADLLCTYSILHFVFILNCSTIHPHCFHYGDMEVKQLVRHNICILCYTFGIVWRTVLGAWITRKALFPHLISQSHSLNLLQSSMGEKMGFGHRVHLLRKLFNTYFSEPEAEDGAEQNQTDSVAAAMNVTNSNDSDYHVSNICVVKTLNGTVRYLLFKNCKIMSWLRSNIFCFFFSK